MKQFNLKVIVDKAVISATKRSVLTAGNCAYWIVVPNVKKPKLYRKNRKFEEWNIGKK